MKNVRIINVIVVTALITVILLKPELIPIITLLAITIFLIIILKGLGKNE